LATTMEIPPPKLPACEPWPMIQQIEKEKEVAGIFLSGHPLDHFQFEMNHYQTISISQYNTLNEEIENQSNSNMPSIPFRIIGLITSISHRTSKTGNKYGEFVLEDRGSKTSFMLFSEDYTKYGLQIQLNFCYLITGSFQKRFEKMSPKIQSILLAEEIKTRLTEKLIFKIPASCITEDLVTFFTKNFTTYSGKAHYEMLIYDQLLKSKVTLSATDKLIELNDELIDYLKQKPEIDVSIKMGQG